MTRLSRKVSRPSVRGGGARSGGRHRRPPGAPGTVAITVAASPRGGSNLFAFIDSTTFEAGPEAGRLSLRAEHPRAAPARDRASAHQPCDRVQGNPRGGRITGHGRPAPQLLTR